MIFPNISFFHMVVTDWTGPLSLGLELSLDYAFGRGIKSTSYELNLAL